MTEKMKTLKDIVAEQHNSRKPQEDPLTARLLAEIVVLAEEVCVLRDRLDTAQRLSDKGESANDPAIDAFELDADIVEARLSRHQDYFEALFARLSITSESP